MLYAFDIKARIHSGKSIAAYKKFTMRDILNRCRLNTRWSFYWCGENCGSAYANEIHLNGLEDGQRDFDIGTNEQYSMLVARNARSTLKFLKATQK